MILQASHVTSMPTSKPASVMVAISYVRALLLKWRDLSLESRNRVITLFSRGYSVLEIQRRLREERTTVSCQALYNLLRKFREKTP